ncbi:probable cytochrome P450 6a13 [Nasonia vitripennis]|uniref:Cytochrome P450 n=1 Tax=Nasonia vitripennis TaxID=7425 RepID=A0A7M7G5F6_NASVI|nr:probable cytochrome P450 6a13 [Nasonia vitripennis]
MTLGFFEVAAGLVVLGLAVYYYFTSNMDFWSSRGVKGPKPVLLFGTTRDLVFGRMSIAQHTTLTYEAFQGQPLVGLFTNQKPILMVRDPELIKDVLIKDFSVFSYRGLPIASKAEPLSQHLFLLEPKRWRPLRQKLSPTFTSGKLKDMFYLLRECAEHLGSFLEDFVEKNPVIECRELAGKFTTDVIGVCAFGLNMNAIAEDDSKFRKIARKPFDSSTLSLMKNYLRFAAPWLMDLLSPIFYDRELNDFFIGTITQTMEYRKKSNVKRNDFIDLLMAIKDDPSKLNDIELTDTLLAAQAFVFFIAGFETSSSTISHTLYELAQNQPIQDKLREEIVEGLKSHNGELTYESVKSMKYLHKIFCETLRKYPPLSVLQRCSLEPYTFAGTKVTIPENTLLWIPAHAIQHDPENYPEPEKFDPDRFEEENVKHRHPSLYLPFGDGPRNCIGARFGIYQTKVGLIQILKSYKVEVCAETCIPYVVDPKKFLLTPLDGIKLKFRKVVDK